MVDVVPGHDWCRPLGICCGGIKARNRLNTTTPQVLSTEAIAIIVIIKKKTHIAGRADTDGYQKLSDGKSSEAKEKRIMTRGLLEEPA